MILRFASAVLAFILFVCVALQYNDPDPVQWMAMYGAAAIVSTIAAFRPGRPAWIWPALIAGAAFVWALTIVPGVIGKIGLGEIFQTMKAETPAIEESREALGLAIVGVWMTVLALSVRRKSRTR